MATATTTKRLYAVDEIERLQRDADREFVEKFLGRLKCNITSATPKGFSTGVKIAALLDDYMESGRLKEAMLITCVLAAVGNGRADECLEVLREIVS